MRMQFPSDMPIWEQIERYQGRKKVGRKHNHTIGPTRQKKQPSNQQKRNAAYRKYKERMALYFAGFLENRPEPPILDK